MQNNYENKLKNVLLVEAFREKRVVNGLKDLGYNVLYVDDGIKCFSELKKKNIDFVLLGLDVSRLNPKFATANLGYIGIYDLDSGAKKAEIFKTEQEKISFQKVAHEISTYSMLSVIFGAGLSKVFNDSTFAYLGFSIIAAGAGFGAYGFYQTKGAVENMFKSYKIKTNS